MRMLTTLESDASPSVRTRPIFVEDAVGLGREVDLADGLPVSRA